MLTFSVMLYVLASLGIIAMGLRYLRAAPPLEYHAEITRDEPPGEIVLRVFGALYQVLGGGYLACGVLMLALSVFGVAQDMLWAKLATLVGSVIAGAAATGVPYLMETRTGVRTPWRIPAALCALILLAFLLSLI